MFRLRLVLLGGVAAVAFTAFSASAASATKFEWSVNGTSLAAGQKLTILIKTDGTITFTAKIGGEKTELVSSESTSEANIQGGKPGTGEGKTTFKGVKVVKPGKCQIAGGEATTERVVSTIVEGTSSKTALILLKPKTGSVFAKIKYENKGTESCILNGVTFEVEGSVLLEPLSASSKEIQLWTFLKSGLQSTSSTGTVSTNNLELGKELANVTGNVSTLLDDDQSFSAL